MAQLDFTRQEPESQMSLLPLKKTTFTLPHDLYKRLKIESARRDIEMSAIVADALRKHLLEQDHEQ
jgi:hypothetical protein